MRKSNQKASPFAGGDMQDYTIYLCTRDTVNPVYSALADLVGLYVEKGA